MTRHLKSLLMILLALATVGCVAQSEADRLRTLNRKAEEQIVELKAQLDEKDARIAALTEAAGRDPKLLRQLEELRTERERLEAALADMEARLRAAAGIAVLPPEVDTALRQLAESNPALMTYDAERGMVKFASDLTFGLGSTKINPTAKAGLAKLAAILNSPAAQRYEVRIVGHTDNVPIRRVRAQHPTNWHLSVHRAIAVKDALEQAGVPPQRMGVAGYSKYRPVVPNGPRGAEANRRVEIYLVPMPQGVTLSNVPDATAAPAAPPDSAAATSTADEPADFK